MADKFDGKWQLHASENFEALMAKTGCPDESIRTAMKAVKDTTLEIFHEGDKWTFLNHTVFGARPAVFQIGVPTPTTTLDKRPLTATLTLEGDTLIRHATGDGFSVKHIRNVVNDEMILILICEDVVAYRRYHRVD
ncbi:sodium/calcium exchanger regulatory protein 1-like [Gigantopelta aegis]|uniref:sodium/calcium exchanger regulatory protein 1-like n=1 Tax=Gigantopelta aegis TaxID=1735272 RepID=UPI001B88A4BD|nr:sodium/calcium exchanger regulatory protein 1-like [Gigantopelta aegis]